MKNRNKYVKWYHRLFIRYMPNFWRDMPMIDIIDDWIPLVHEVNRFGKTHTVKKGDFKSCQKAYVKARWSAYWLDRNSRYTSNHSIHWEIITKENYEKRINRMH